MGGHVKCLAVKLNQSLENINNASLFRDKSGTHVPFMSLPHYASEFISSEIFSCASLVVLPLTFVSYVIVFLSN